jgi:DNA (cytosine-5)-methyltransferase 1
MHLYLIFLNRQHTLKAKPSSVDLFCGAGGLSEGFRQAGFDNLLGIDSENWAVVTYSRRHGKASRKDIHDVDANHIFKATGREDIDVILGGPPCQAFSSIAVAKWRALGIPSTVQHPVNQLYAEFLRIVLDVKPKFFVMENVERMLSIDEGAVKRDIETRLQNMYTISFYKFDVADFGVPQYRKRALVIGNKLGIPNPVIETTHSKDDRAKKPHVTVGEAIADLPRIQAGEVEERMRYPSKMTVSEYARERRAGSSWVYNHIARPHNKRDLKIFSMLRPGQRIGDLPARYNPYRKDIFQDKYKKQPWNRPSSTILAHLSKDGLMFIHPDKSQNRSLTAREAARLQSFDDSYVFMGYRTYQYKQIGNAVPPLFAKAVADSIMKGLKIESAILSSLHNRRSA